MRSNKGITLIVLVITIIVLIVLAGVAIASLSGNNSIVDRAQEAKTKSEESTTNEESRVSEYETKIQEKTGGGYSGPNIWQTEYGLSTGDLTYNYDYVGDYITMAFLSDGSVYGSGGSVTASDIAPELAKEDGVFKVYSNYVTLKVSADTTIKYLISGDTIEVYMNDSKYDTLKLTNTPRTSL